MHEDSQTIGDLAFSLWGFMAMAGVKAALRALDDCYGMIEYHVHTGRPSWHQSRAGHRSAGVSVFHSRAKAEAYLGAYQGMRPDEPAFIVVIDKAGK